MWLWALLAACGGTRANYLEGSLAETYAIAFDETRARLYESELAVEYVVFDPELGETVALRVTVINDGLAAGTTFALPNQGAIGRSDAYGSSFPELDSGQVELDEWVAENDAQVEGSFEATFTTTEDDRLTLRGGFSAPLELVEL